MKRRFLLPFILFCCLFFLPLSAHAHPGHTDSNGGHYDYETGEYHYHHGYPAHSHDGGKCPYNFHDNTDDNYYPSSGSYYAWPYTVAPRPFLTYTPSPTSSPSSAQQPDSSVSIFDDSVFTLWHWLLMMSAVCIFLFVLCQLTHRKSTAKKALEAAKYKRAEQIASDNVYYQKVEIKRRTMERVVSTTPPPIQPRRQVPSVSSSIAPTPQQPPAAHSQPEYIKITPPPSSPTPPPVKVSVKITPTIPQQKTIAPAASPALPLEPSEKDIPNAPAIYRQNYPRTWSYIQRNSKNAHSYVYYYHYVWGKLQEHHGDGIIYGTLSPSEQALVNYPHVGETVFLSSEDSDSYHSTPNCYSLLKSTPIEVDSIHVIVRKRCTKCVPPQSLT